MSSLNNSFAACNNNTNSTNDEKYKANAVISNYSDEKYFRNKKKASIKLDLAKLIESEDQNTIVAPTMDKKQYLQWQIYHQHYHLRQKIYEEGRK